MNKYQDVCDAIFEGLIKNDKALEINTSGLFMDMKDTLPNISFVKRYKNSAADILPSALTLIMQTEFAKALSRGLISHERQVLTALRFLKIVSQG